MLRKKQSNLKNKYFYLIWLVIALSFAVVLAGCGGQMESDQSVPTGSVYLAWDPPVQNTDNTQIGNSELSGYRIYYGSQPGVYAYVVNISDPSTTSVSIGTDINQEYFFVLTALNVYGNESSFSQQISRIAM